MSDDAFFSTLIAVLIIAVTIAVVAAAYDSPPNEQERKARMLIECEGKRVQCTSMQNGQFYICSCKGESNDKR